MADPNGKNLLDLLRQALGPKLIQKYLVDPTTCGDFDGEDSVLQHYVDASIRWVGECFRVEIVDTTSFVLSNTGEIDLDQGADSKVSKIIRVKQNGHIFPEAKTVYPNGFPTLVGSWTVWERRFFALGDFFFRSSTFWSLPHFSQYHFSVPATLQEGPIEVVYYGIPTEEQLECNELLRRAAVNYAVHLALMDVATQVARPARIRMTGVPDVTDNAATYERQSEMRLRAAERSITEKVITLGG